MAEEDLTPTTKKELTFSEESNWDQSKRAEAVLQHILSTEGTAGGGAQNDQVKQVAVSEAIHARPVLQLGTGRTRARVLFVTTDENVLVPDSTIRQDYTHLAEQFDEIHVLCLINRGGSDAVDRFATNAWAYKVHYHSHWDLKGAAKDAVREALIWNDDFRADVVVGVDPFEAGLAAYTVARSYDRPLQLHVSTNFLAANFRTESPENKWRYRKAKSLCKKADSVRVITEQLKNALEKKYRKLKDLEVLPRFYNFTDLLQAKPAFDLHSKYPDFAFIMLAFGPLTADSPLHDLFAALHQLLHNQRIGLIVIGNGPGETLFTNKVKLLGVEKSVVFQKKVEDLTSYLKTANALVEVDTGEAGEVRVLQAAAAGLPIVAMATDLRRDLFKDGAAALLSEPGDLMDLKDNLSQLINHTALRRRIADGARLVASSRINEDPQAHYQAMAATIESVLVK